ncbi:hypothetical protein [Enterococcus rotai]|uniref:hypothetical protein n=1 Tax=Enterococcus rotai TaxID=118060 RepID=UPI0035C6F50E
MRLEQLRNLLSALDDDIEVRVSVQECEENEMRDFRYEDGSSQSLEGVNIKGNILILKGTK